MGCGWRISVQCGVDAHREGQRDSRGTWHQTEGHRDRERWRETKKGGRDLQGGVGAGRSESPPSWVPDPAHLCLQMLLHLFSDANYNLLGFNASFRFSLCPGGCHSHGQCRPPGVCACEPGWGGPDCGLQECSAYCGSHGTCASVSLSLTVSPWGPDL